MVKCFIRKTSRTLVEQFANARDFAASSGLILHICGRILVRPLPPEEANIGANSWLSDQGDVMNLDYLETIVKFIGTYGLAVFLVLYYAVKLYPETQKERDEWIRQITRLRQLVDPATRPLTRDQARTVLQLASDSLADRLMLVLESGGEIEPNHHR